VKWWCKRPPEILVTGFARKALSGAMPNREAKKCCPHDYGFRLQLPFTASRIAAIDGNNVLLKQPCELLEVKP